MIKLSSTSVMYIDIGYRSIFKFQVKTLFMAQGSLLKQSTYSIHLSFSFKVSSISSNSHPQHMLNFNVGQGMVLPQVRVSKTNVHRVIRMIPIHLDRGQSHSLVDTFSKSFPGIWRNLHVNCSSTSYLVFHHLIIVLV